MAFTGGLAMRIDITLASADRNEKIIVPLHYNKVLQGLIYSQLRNRIPAVHESGWQAKGRAFRMFVFSRLNGKVERIQERQIHFLSPIRFSVASPIQSVAEALAEGFLKASELRLGSAILELDKIAVVKSPDLSSGHMRCRAISPVTVYSTMLSPEGKKKTYYYHPAEEEFRMQIEDNLRKKAKALGIPNADNRQIRLETVQTRTQDQKVLFYNNIVIKGWMGTFEFTGDPELLALALDAGIGAKNSQGFGMLQKIEKYNVRPSS